MCHPGDLKEKAVHVGLESLWTPQWKQKLYNITWNIIEQ